MTVLALLNVLWNSAHVHAKDARSEHSPTFRYVPQPDGTYQKETVR